MHPPDGVNAANLSNLPVLDNNNMCSAGKWYPSILLHGKV